MPGPAAARAEAAPSGRRSCTRSRAGVPSAPPTAKTSCRPRREGGEGDSALVVHERVGGAAQTVTALELDRLVSEQPAVLGGDVEAAREAEAEAVRPTRQRALEVHQPGVDRRAAHVDALGL